LPALTLMTSPCP